MTGLERRTLLGAGLLAGAGAALAGCTAGTPAPKPPAFDPGDWASVRAQFALDPSVAHFEAFMLASHPAPVRAAVQRHRDGLDASPEYHPDGAVDADANVRRAAARFLGASGEQIALTDSTTMGLGLLYSGLGLLPGQDVLTTEHDFLATHESLRLLGARTGAKVRRVALYDDPAKASQDEIVGRLAKAVGPRTRVVAITWVHSSTGVRLPVRAIADALAEANRGRAERDRALLCVDGVHGFGAIADGVDDLGCDFLATGTHKWLFGPRGTGILYGRTLNDLSPTIPSFSGAAFDAWFTGTAPSASGGQLVTPGGYKAFEHRWAVTEAFAFMEAIGPERVQERAQELATRLKRGLAAIPGVRVHTPADPALSAGLVCCSIDGLPPAEAVRRLRAEHALAASTTPYRESYLRFGTSMVVTPEQVDQAVKAVAALV
ncbi:aminotransferase class V-fold PLP-dependent enzyme [Nonomuraea sp. NPDC046570]|uniref:aminotransferase class V-fold PLP-dependent enzyme n=1 Tax=Nonomuraea sp. NPDC046570 TaxID=3155255 RepID=UPI0033C3F44B